MSVIYDCWGLDGSWLGCVPPSGLVKYVVSLNIPSSVLNNHSYTDRDTAFGLNLAYVTDDDIVIMKGDNTTTLPDGQHRNRWLDIASSMCLLSNTVIECPYFESYTVQHRSVHSRSGPSSMGMWCLACLVDARWWTMAIRKHGIIPGISVAQTRNRRRPERSIFLKASMTMNTIKLPGIPDLVRYVS